VTSLNTGVYPGAKSKDGSGHFPPKEKPPVLRDICQVQLQLREAVPLAGEEACWVS
jgi:hypothetical protein